MAIAPSFAVVQVAGAEEFFLSLKYPVISRVAPGVVVPMPTFVPSVNTTEGATEVEDVK
jgi:hypothetical protein